MITEQFPLRPITDSLAEENIEDQHKFARREKLRVLEALIAVSHRFVSDEKQLDALIIDVAHESGLFPQQEANA